MYFLPTCHEQCQALMFHGIIVRPTQRDGLYKNARICGAKAPIFRLKEIHVKRSRYELPPLELY
jgi:hypothetical protein